MPYSTRRRQIIYACLKINDLGINQGTAGNISVRIPEGLLITPSGMPYEELVPEDIVMMPWDGKIKAGSRSPSSEWRFHRDILKQRPEVGAVVHTHAMFCTTLACLGLDIPAFHYMVAVAGGDSICCAPYATFGSQDLSDRALEALDGRQACLLANHGMIALGSDLNKALAMAVEVETLAAQYWRALQIAKPHLLPTEEMALVLEKFASYGKTECYDVSKRFD